MLSGPCLRSILLFSLPIFLGNLFQVCYNMVDSMVVGQFVSANALAAVGSCGPITHLLVNSMVGFTSGASVVASQFFGAGYLDRIKATISTTLCFLLALALSLTLLGLALAPGIMRWVSVPEAVFADTVLYFRIYVSGLLFMAVYNFFAAFLRSIGDSTTPLIFLILSSLLNIGGDLYFVLVLKLGVAGVAWATVIAQGISAVLCILYGRRSELFRFSRGEFILDRRLLRDILRLGLPTGLQNSVSSLGVVIVQRLINSFGPVSMAAYTAVSRMEQFCSMPMGSIGTGLSVFVGQNIGAKQIDRVKRGLWQSVICSVLIGFALSMIVFFCGENLMGLFVRQSETEVIRLGASFVRKWAPLVWVHGICFTIMALLRGAGDAVHAMIALFSDLLLRMVTSYALALGFGLGLMGVAYAIPCGWCVSCVYALIRYSSGKWKNKAVV